MRNLYQVFSILLLIIFFSGCGVSKLSQSALNGNLNGVKQAIRDGDDVNDGSFGYMQACLKKHNDIIKYISDHNIKSVFQYRCLKYSAGLGNMPLVKYFIGQKHLEADRKDAYEITPLINIIFAKVRPKIYHYNYSANELEIAKYLVDHGASLDKVTKFFRGNNRPDNQYGAAYRDFMKQYKIYISGGKLPQRRDMVTHISYTNTKQQKTNNNDVKALVQKYEKENKLKELKELTQKNPNAVYYISNLELRLLLTGPKGMKIGDIKKYLLEGKSEIILVSLIKQQEQPYKKFNMQEIELLQKMGLSDKIISAMIDETTRLLRDKKLQKQQEYFLSQQKNILKSQQNVQYQNNNNTSGAGQHLGNRVYDEAKQRAINKGINMLFDKLF